MHRRDLLKLFAYSPGLYLVPRWVFAETGDNAERDHMVVIFLRGGADGLSVVPPVGESRYFDLRPGIAVSESEALDLDGFFALHPAAGGLKTLYDAGDLAVIHAAGLGTAERSHFLAQSAMEQGIDPVDAAAGDGWLARYLAGITETSPLAAVALDTALPQSMAGASGALAVSSVDGFSLALDPGTRAALAALYDQAPILEPTANAVFDAADALAPVAEIPRGEGYPPGPLADVLADTARLIKGETGLAVAALNAGGWDHHDDQVARMAPLLEELGGALAAFRNDLGVHWDDTMVVVQTEFGRRAAENASGGTDHGHGGIMLTAGGGVNGGRVFTNWPGLAASELSAGEDLAVSTDYRQVLAEAMVKRLGVADPSVVFEGWQPGPWQGIYDESIA